MRCRQKGLNYERSRLGDSPRGLEAGVTVCRLLWLVQRAKLNSWMRWAMQVLGGHHS